MKKLNINHNEVIALYEKGFSSIKIAETYKCSDVTIRRILHKENITLKNNSVYRRKNIFNYRFFETINNEEKAYWLGFIYADGNIHTTKSNQKVITLVSKDEEVVIKYIQSIHGNFEHKTKNGKYHNVVLTSDEMYNDLLSVGVTEQKSLTLTFPKIKEGLINHFIRGYFDGDGSVFTTKPKNYNKTNTIYQSIAVDITGTFEFLSVLCEHLPVSFPQKEKRTTTNVWYCRKAGSNNIKLVHDYLYKDATIYMERKKNVFDKYYLK